MKKILMIVTSHEDMEKTNSKTGLWLGEFTDPYYEFIENGYEVDIASPKGGKPPIDPLSKLTKNITSSNRKFNSDKKAQAALENTKRLNEVRAEDYTALFFPGGHGPMWDLANDEKSGRLILDFLNHGKYVGAICHGPSALLKAEELQPGLLKGRKMTGFSNIEEKLAFRHNNIPWSLEDRLKEAGAEFHTAAIPYLSHIEKDGLLITGQNPMAARPAAKALIEALKK